MPFGSEADIQPCPGDVRFTPKSGQWKLRTTVVARPCFPALFDEQPNDCQRTNAINPPGTEQPLSGESNDDHERQPAAGYGFDCVGAERPASNLVGNGDLALREIPHRGDCN